MDKNSIECSIQVETTEVWLLRLTKIPHYVETYATRRPIFNAIQSLKHRERILSLQRALFSLGQA